MSRKTFLDRASVLAKLLRPNPQLNRSMNSSNWTGNVFAIEYDAVNVYVSDSAKASD